MLKPLYNDALAPITTEVGFLQCGVEKAASIFFNWHTKICYPLGQTVDTQNLIGPSLDILLKKLLPLTDLHLRFLFVPTKTNWTAYFDNGWRGADPASVTSYLAEEIGCLGIRAAWEPHTLKGDHGQFGAAVFEVYDRPNPILNVRRSVALIHDGYKWDFETSGEPFPFEQTERYKARRKTDRFTPEMLDTYLKELGIDAFSEDFYFATKQNPAKLISTKGAIPKSVKQYSLEAAREDY